MVPVTRLVERKRDQIEAVIRGEERRCCCAGKSGGIEVTAIAQPMWKADANKTAAWMLLTTGPACQQKPRGFSLLHAHYTFQSQQEHLPQEMPHHKLIMRLYEITPQHAVFSLASSLCRAADDNKSSKFSLTSAATWLTFTAV
jgi:hypothetical protein